MPAGDQKVTSDSAVNLTPEVVKVPAFNTDFHMKVTDAERDPVETELTFLKKRSHAHSQLLVNRNDPCQEKIYR